MKRRHFLIAATLLASAAMPLAAQAQDAPVVAVSQIVEHPALDAARKGLRDGLADAGYVDGSTLTFKYQTAQGNPAIAAQIARQFIGEGADVLVGIATPTAQALVAATEDIPVVFTAVTDPVGAKLIDDMDAPGGNVTGLSDMSPVAQHVEMMKSLLPELKTIGVVYNPGEANAVSLLTALKAAAESMELEVVEAAATKTADVQSAAQSVGAKSDIIYAMTDNTVASAIDALIAGANDTETPVFGGETSYVERGAVAALGFDYYQIGYQTAEYVARILKGEKPGDLPAQIATGSDIVVNVDAARAAGIELPMPMLATATAVHGELSLEDRVMILEAKVKALESIE